MIKNYLKTAFRNLLKQKMYAVINIVGLAVGIACCLLIILFVRDEMGYDTHFKRQGDIYRIYADIVFGELDGDVAPLPAPLAPTLMKEFPEVESAVRMRSRGSFLIRKKGTVDNFKEERIIFADHEVFEVFSIPLLKGNRQTILSKPNTLVLTQRLAEKYFPDEDPIGQTLTLDNERDYEVVGVMGELPKNTHFHFDVFLAMEGLEESKQSNWLSHNFHTYALLKPGSDPEAFEAKFPKMLATYAGPLVQQYLNLSWQEWMEGGNRIGYHVMPLSDIHLHSDMSGELEPNGDMAYVYIFSAIALFILLIACINFMNLATARSANRAKEVGVRKVMGAYRNQLVGQFMTESILFGLISFVLALILAELFLPYFNTLSGKELALPWSMISFVPLLLLGAVIVGGMAGMYPAFFLSAFQPIETLKGKLASGARSGTLRSVLVVFQFVMSISLIICTIIVNRQLSFIQNKKLGFDREQVMVLDDTYVLDDQVETFKQELLNLPQVSGVTVSSFLPVGGNNNNNAFWPKGQRVQEKTIILNNWYLDHDYIQTMGMEIIKGRDFSIDFATDSNAVILNEAAVKSFGFTDPLGEKISSFIDLNTETGEEVTGDYQVIGIVKDFHFQSMREPIAPVGLFIGRNTSSMAIKLHTEDMKLSLMAIEAKWREFAPGQPFSYEFMDDQFVQTYETESRLGNIYLIFSVLAIFVACLGLFALASFIAEQRSKEIGIRKVLGASVSQIVTYLSKDFMRLVGIALLLAIPIAWYFMYRWLEGFQYRTDLNADVFIFAAVIALAIALLTVSYQSIRAAIANPIHALKEE